jgi:hypothetical protein
MGKVRRCLERFVELLREPRCGLHRKTKHMHLTFEFNHMRMFEIIYKLLSMINKLIDMKTVMMCIIQL